MFVENARTRYSFDTLKSTLEKFCRDNMSEKVVIRSRRTSAIGPPPLLKCTVEGRVIANSSGRAIEGQREDQWTVHRVGRWIALESWKGKFLSAQSDGTVVADRDEIWEWELWRVQYLDSHYVTFQSHFGKYLVCDGESDSGYIVLADRDNACEWEQWSVFRKK
jgi:hypothetical protein